MANAIALIGLLLTYSDKIAQIGALLTKAHAEGRDVTSEELDALFADDDLARVQLESAIKAAKAAGK